MRQAMSMDGEARQVCVRSASLHARGDLDGAIAEIEQALQIDPRCAEAWNNRGAIRYARGDACGAMADFDRALEVHPCYSEAYNNRGIVRHATGDFAGALIDFDQALQICPRYAEALANRGITRHALGNLAGAMADFNLALDIYPNYAEALLGRAFARHDSGEYDEAIADCDEVLQLIPRLAAAKVYHLRGGIRVSQRRIADAVADFDRALEIDPRFCMAYISRGNARHHLRDLAGQADYWTAFQINPQGAAAEITRVLIANLQAEGESALETCRKHVRVCPNDIVAYARRGLSLLLLGKEADAALDLDQIFRRWPDWRDNIELVIKAVKQQRGQ
ncbi:MAG: tetratricopeptide repeat protein [Thermoguttaceae bacterium]